MASKHGPQEVFVYLDGYDLLLNGVTNLDYGPEALTAEVSGLGSGARKHAPTGMTQSALSFEGTLFDDGTNRSRSALNQITSGPSASDRIFSLGMMGTSIGSTCDGFQGAIQGSYRVIASHEDLHRIAASFEISGMHEPGAVLYPMATVTSDANSQSTSVNNGSSSTGGLAGYLHVNAFDGDTGDQFLVVIQESSDNAVYADLLTFTCTSSTGTPFKERATVASSGVEQYLAVSWAFTDSGIGNADFFVMAARTTA